MWPLAGFALWPRAGSIHGARACVCVCVCACVCVCVCVFVPIDKILL